MMPTRLMGLGHRITRWGLLILLMAGLCLPALPTLLNVHEGHLETRRLNGLIARHQRALSVPIAPNRYTSFAIFTTPGAEQPANTSGDTLQADLSRLLQAPDMRLLELRRLNDETDITGLVGLRLQGELDGDLQALLSRLAALSAEYPRLEVETLELTPRGRSDRPDRNMRLEVTFILWMETN